MRRDAKWTGPRSMVLVASVLVILVARGGVARAFEPSPIVRVRQGWLRGIRAGDGLDRYLGVPYAAPPVGALRWKPPEPPAPWRGLRAAESLPPRCAQIGNEGPGAEDCLYLNVFVPRHPHRPGRLPVLFYIHGGSLRVGSSWDDDPSRIASETETIVVMVNYRLGMLGFLAHPALDQEAEGGVSGNYGLLDQQAALRWVHEEIDAFGGDPSRVTIGGASAGAWSVCAHLTSEANRGSFAHAIMQSGDCYAQTVDYVEATGLRFASALGCAGDTGSAASCLRAKSASELLAADSWSYEADIVWGGPLLPEAPAAAVAAGRFQHVPLFFGFTENEVRSEAAFLYPMTPADYLANLGDAFGGHAADVMSLYPSSSYPDPFYAFADALDDSGIAGPGSCLLLGDADTFSRQVPTYVYQFDDQTAPNPSWITAAPGFVDGASHGSDEPYWFDRPGDPIAPLDDGQRALAHQMVQFLGAFVERGAPSVDSQSHWPRYDPSRQRVMRLRLESAAVTTSVATDNHCSFWRSLGL